MRDELPARVSRRSVLRAWPWNVGYAWASTLDANGLDELQWLFNGVEGTTGFVVTGPKARRFEGPAIAAIEDLERVPPGCCAQPSGFGERDGRRGWVAWLAASDADELDWMEGQARPALGPRGTGDNRGASAADSSGCGRGRAHAGGSWGRRPSCSDLFHRLF